MNALDNIATFTISILFDLALMLCLLRVLLQWHRAPFQNPVCQLVGRLTNPLVQPLAKISPKFPRLDFAALLIGYVIALLKPLLLSFIKIGAIFFGPGYLLFGLILIVSSLINILFFSIIFLIILSWLNPGVYNPVSEILTLITQPLLRPIQRRIPPIAGFDLSPLIALFGLKLLEIIIHSLLGIA